MSKTDLVLLEGSPRDRGVMQSNADPAIRSDVLRAIEGPLRDSAAFLSTPQVRDYLDAQWRFTKLHGKNHLEEIKGLAQGFGYTARDLFAFLHLSFLNPKTAPADGCSTIALSRSAEGPLLAKNRDYGGEHRQLQRVFLHLDPTQNGKRCLFVGSLGCPGAFSSGMNSDGLALVDTRVDRNGPGVGWLRYFLMTELLWKTSTVGEAVDFIRANPHVGGGSITITDPGGCIAAVELGSPDAQIEMKNDGGFVHTNHFVSEPLARTMDLADSADDRNSVGRLDVLREALPDLTDCANRHDIQRQLSTHGDDDHRICEHAGPGTSPTISSAIYLCQTKELVFSNGPPCQNNWQTFSL